MGFGTLNKLMERVDMVRSAGNHRLALFSLSGFDDDLEEYAEQNGIFLFDLEILIHSKDPPHII